MAFFGKVVFIQKLSVTQNTGFRLVKNKFLLSHLKLVFFTRFYLTMAEGAEVGRGQDVVGGLRGTVDSSGHTGETPAIRLHYLPALYTL